VESGEYRHLLMAQSVRHCLALQFFQQLISMHLLGSSLNGVESYFLFLYPVQMF